MNIKIAASLKSACVSDEALAGIAEKVILGKRNDSSLRAARSHNTGFKYYTDKQGNIYYNLIEVFKELGVKI